MKFWKNTKKMLTVLMMTLFMGMMTYPAAIAYGATAQVENQAPVAVTEVLVEDDGSTMLLMGGGLFVILIAVIVAVASVATAVVLAANMDMDGE